MTHALDSKKPDLRERRKHRTMETIRDASMELVIAHGLDNVTTEMIAEAAGISLRTFFNYFAYKEEALIPPPLGFPPEAAARFIAGTAPILEDLLGLLDERLVELERDRRNIRAIMAIADAHPRLLAVRERTFRQYEAEFRNLLGKRLKAPPAHETPTLMAALISATFRVAMCRWVEEDNGKIRDIFEQTISALPALFNPTSHHIQ